MVSEKHNKDNLDSNRVPHMEVTCTLRDKWHFLLVSIIIIIIMFFGFFI